LRVSLPLPTLKIALILSGFGRTRHGLPSGCEKQARVGAGGKDDDAALHKYLSYR